MLIFKPIPVGKQKEVFTVSDPKEAYLGSFLDALTYFFLYLPSVHNEELHSFNCSIFQ